MISIAGISFFLQRTASFAGKGDEKKKPAYTGKAGLISYPCQVWDEHGDYAQITKSIICLTTTKMPWK